MVVPGRCFAFEKPGPDFLTSSISKFNLCIDEPMPRLLPPTSKVVALSSRNLGAYCCRFNPWVVGGVKGTTTDARSL